MQKIIPCVWIEDKVEEIADLYLSVFENSKKIKTTYYRNSFAEVSRKKVGTVLTIDLQLAGFQIQLLNGGAYYKQTSALSFFVQCSSVAQLDAVYNKLSVGGQTLMPLAEYPFSKRYAFFTDTYGVHWQLFLDESNPQKITPSLIFGGELQGAGPKALAFYSNVFKDSQIITDMRYGKNQGNCIEGSLMHARVALDSSELVMMDAGDKHPMPITGGVSFMVMCQDQNEVDYFWNAFAEKGQESQCGWISDQFGVMWQIVPRELESLVFSSDETKADLATKAMLSMRKLDINVIRSAYHNK